jgi:hypothetical protein
VSPFRPSFPPQFDVYPKEPRRLSLAIHYSLPTNHFLSLSLAIHYSLPTNHFLLSTFRINTCKSVSKQMTLTPFRINTYRKTVEGGYPPTGLRLGHRPTHAPLQRLYPCALIRLRILSHAARTQQRIGEGPCFTEGALKLSFRWIQNCFVLTSGIPPGFSASVSRCPPWQIPSLPYGGCSETVNCKLSTVNCSSRQPGGPVRGAGRRRSAGRRSGSSAAVLSSFSPSSSMHALRPSMPLLLLSSDAHRATRRGFGWSPGSKSCLLGTLVASALQHQRRGGESLPLSSLLPVCLCVPACPDPVGVENPVPAVRRVL